MNMLMELKHQTQVLQLGQACLGAGISEMEFMKALFPLDYRRIYRRMSGMTFGA